MDRVCPTHNNDSSHFLNQVTGAPLVSSKSIPCDDCTATKNGRYKTELCRSFSESGYCRYEDKCQFAHGDAELRGKVRHGKYKTKLCRNFHGENGHCDYGPRCHYIHKESADDLEIKRKFNRSISESDQPNQTIVNSEYCEKTPEKLPHHVTYPIRISHSPESSCSLSPASVLSHDSGVYSRRDRTSTSSYDSVTCEADVHCDAADPMPRRLRCFQEICPL